MGRYIAKEFETKWQEKWQETGIYKAINGTKKAKKYILDMFPYPSGDGLHVGHFKVYVASDILSRYFRHKGFNVLHPMGWDAFGLPAENYAIKTGIHPTVTTAQNISNIKKQMQIAGLSYDWSREINTTDPNYYKWTQWIFLRLFEKGLAYEAEAPINWCPKDKTGLANEEVVAGRCERCGTKVVRKVIRQWVLKITEYAERLLADLGELDWPEFIKQMQVNWIGKSQGVLVKFDIENKDFDIQTFTTRIDTLFGVTALVLAPEHPRLGDLTTKEQRKAVQEYIKASASKSDLERTDLAKQKSGVFTGNFALHPLTGKRLQIWVSDYVLGFYGTGAVMLVPAHDERDLAFAQNFGLEIRQIIEGQGEEAVLINSQEFSQLNVRQAKEKITQALVKIKHGNAQVSYKLRDWVFSRQRYWGEPIPLVHCQKCGIVPVPETELPVKLPQVEEYQPSGTGESPLANIAQWVNVTCPKCGGSGKRETNTMPQWAGSCWYYLRFIDPDNQIALVDKILEKYWMPVDWYLGGAEHAVLHLLYARFWHKFLYDLGVVSTVEPFRKLSSVGLVLSYDGQKMSKSKGNVIRPEGIIDEYGADTLRVYEAFMGPFEASIAWDPKSINGVYRFLNRVWEVVLKADSKGGSDQERALNQMLVKVSKDIESLKFNTAVSAMMEFINQVYSTGLTMAQKSKLLIALAPFAPHITEQLWSLRSVGDNQQWSIHQQPWPQIDETLLEKDKVNLVIQVDGKVRDQILISKDMFSNYNDIEKLALSSTKAKKFIDKKPIIKTVYIPMKIINFVLMKS